MRGATAIDARRDAGLAFVCTGAWYGSFAVSGADIERDLDISHARYGLLLAAAFTFMAIGHYAGGKLEIGRASCRERV